MSEEDALEVSPIEKMRLGDTSVDNMMGVLGQLHLSKGNGRLAQYRDDRTGKKVYKDPGAAASRQLTGDPFKELAGGEYVEPQHNPEILAATVENNTRLGRSIRTYARNTLGLGWHIEPKLKITKETDETVKERVKQQTAIIDALFSNPNDDMPTNSIFYNIKVDEETTGNGYLEVVRNTFGIITSVYHVPAITMRKRVMTTEDGDKEVQGFVQIQGNDKVYFKEFGDTRPMSASKGEYFTESDVDPEDMATEIIHFRLYTPMNYWYGAPRYISAAPAITGNRFAAIRNVKFFENDAVPRMAVMVSGGKLTAEVMQQIEDYFKGKSLGVEKAHNCLIIQAEQQNTGFDKSGGGPTIDLKPLTVGVTEDASFQTYREANDEEIRECFGIGQVFFASDSTNRASAACSREITNEQEFEPDRLEKEYIINQKLIPALLRLKSDEIVVTFRFERMKLTDPLDLARMDQTYAALGAITPNELRESIGKDPYPMDYAFANKPLQVSMAQMTLHQSEAVKDDWKNEQIYQKGMQKIQQQGQQQPGGMGGMPGMPGAGGGMDMGGGDAMGLDDIFGGLGDAQGEAQDQGGQEEKDITAEADSGDRRKQYGNIELMKIHSAIENSGLPTEKKILIDLLLKSIVS